MCEIADVPDLVDLHQLTCDDDDEGDYDGWNEEVTGEQTTCLFCPLQFRTIAVALDHCRTDHRFDLLDLKNKFNMDCYSYIKMINFIRSKKPNPKDLTGSSEVLWNDDVYFRAVLDTDPWLQYDFDDLGSAPSTPHYAIDGKTPISNINYSDMQRTIFELTQQLKEKDALLEEAMSNMERMKEVTRAIVDSGDASVKNSSRVNASSDYDSDYFNSYTHFGIHHEMLTDNVRTASYRDAILENADSFAGKTVLDVGCGTGILSMFSAKAGASKVYGVDQSDVIYNAIEIVRENKLEDVISVSKDKIEEAQLPVDKVDILVSEFMGYFLLFEGMIDSFIYARDRFLKKDGLILPNRCNMSLVGCFNPELYKNLIEYWDDVHGFSMSCMKREVLKDAFIEFISDDMVITEPVVLTELDLKTCTPRTCDFTSKFTLKVTKRGTLNCLVGYFDTFFDLPHSVQFSTGPHATKTHWKQAVFFLKNPLVVTKGDIVGCSLTCSRSKSNVRGLIVRISLAGDEYQYHLD